MRIRDSGFGFKFKEAPASPQARRRCQLRPRRTPLPPPAAARGSRSSGPRRSSTCATGAAACRRAELVSITIANTPFASLELCSDLSTPSQRSEAPAAVAPSTSRSWFGAVSETSARLQLLAGRGSRSSGRRRSSTCATEAVACPSGFTHQPVPWYTPVNHQVQIQPNHPFVKNWTMVNSVGSRRSSTCATGVAACRWFCLKLLRRQSKDYF